MYAFRFPAVEGGRGNPRDLIGTVNTQSIPALARQPERAAEFLRLVNSRWFQAQMVQQAQMISPLIGMPLPGSQQGLDQVLAETERFYSFSFGLEGAHPFLYRQYWNEWNQFMVARALSASQLVENLESIFARYYEHFAA